MRAPRAVAHRAARPAGAVAGVLLAASALLAGCGNSDKSATGSSLPAAQDVAGGSKLDATWPLTGLPVTGDATAAQRHPVIVLKMDNTEASSPQMGLGKADLVVEELVEGGLTRLAAFYYSQIPGVVGPVRSMRASDIGIVSPVHASMVTSGAAAVTIHRIEGAHIHFYAEGAKGFFRDSSRSAPYNLFTNLSQTATLTRTSAQRPPDYLPWGPEKAFPHGQAATHIGATFSGGHTTNWVYRNGTYVNENTFAAAGDQFPATTVLVLRVPVGDAGYLDPAGNPVPETHLMGTGPALVFHGGRLVRGTWSKSDLGSAISLATKAGKLSIPAGHVWIELVPQATGGVTFSK